MVDAWQPAFRLLYLVLTDGLKEDGLFDGWAKGAVFRLTVGLKAPVPFDGWAKTPSFI